MRKHRFGFDNQWSRKPGSRDITWLGIEHSTFQLPDVERNVHVYICGVGVVYWFTLGHT